MEVKFYDMNEVDESSLFAAVIVSRYRGKWVLCKNKERGKWEVPGGHREENETILETAKRELFEETGAKEFEITPICPYSLSRYAMLFYADIMEFGDMPESEIERIDFFSELPDDEEMTFPMLHTALVKKAMAVMNIE
ncbi:MAG: NUDIX domain-containing protein [Acutalibacteraceae bacterium]